MRPRWPDNVLVRSRSVRADRAAIGTFLHSPSRFQRETAQQRGAGTVGLSGRRKTCNRSTAARCPRVATHLFQSLDLEGQVRAPIRSLPVFLRPCNIRQTWAKPRPVGGLLGRFVAISACHHAVILLLGHVPVMSSCQEHQSRKGTWQCRSNTSRWPSHYAAGLLPVGRQPVNRSSMVPAQARSARSSWMATLSPAPLSAPQQTSFFARKTPASADRTVVSLALTFRSAEAGSTTTQMPCPDVFRGRHLAFRPSAQQGPTRAQGTANV